MRNGSYPPDSNEYEKKININTSLIGELDKKKPHNFSFYYPRKAIYNDLNLYSICLFDDPASERIELIESIDISLSTDW